MLYLIARSKPVLRAASRAASVVVLQLGLLPSVSAQATADTPMRLDAARLATNNTGLKILGGWGALNVVAGVLGAGTANDEEAKRFHQMNALWGGVNLALAGFGLHRARRDANLDRAPDDGFSSHRRDRRTFGINTGLDVLYAGTGAYLVHRGNRHATGDPELLRGYGQSLILQGAALFLFDAAMWAAHGRRSRSWRRLMERIAPAESGAGLRISF